MSHRIVILLLLLFIGTPAGAEPTKHRYVLPMNTAVKLQRMLDLKTKLPGQKVLNASIQKDRVLLRVGSLDKPVLHVTLVRAEGAPKDAPRAAGFALIRAPGPAPSVLVKDILRRLSAYKTPIAWQKIAPESPVNVPVAREEEGLEKHRETLDRVRHGIVIGQPDKAKSLLSKLPKRLRPEARLVVAELWHLLKEKKRVAGVLGDMTSAPPAMQAASEVLLGKPVNISKALEGRDRVEGCDFYIVAELLGRLNRTDEALKWAQAVRKAYSECAESWVHEVELLLDTDQVGAARERAAEAAKRFPNHVSVLAVAATQLRSDGKLAEAAFLQEKVARLLKGKDASLRNWLATVVRSGVDRERLRNHYDEALRKNPEDPMFRFIIGVFKHYDNEFKGSNALLRPLEPVFPEADRMHVYLAMNDFNLGLRKEALERLSRRADGAVPDADIFYCRAEILRDTDRKQALADLQRYRAMSEGRAFSNPEKDDRVAGMVKLLQACIKDGRAECEGAWEHPRLRHAPGDPYWIWIVLVGLLLFGGGLWAWTRRRGAAAS